MIDIKVRTAELIKENFDIPKEVTFAMFQFGLLEEHVCKIILIREEFHKKARHKQKTDLKILLAEKYCVSLSTINKYLAIA